MNADVLIQEVISLPVEKRILLLDKLLGSLNQPESDIDQSWREIATKRLMDLRSGQAVLVDGEQVFNKLFDRIKK